MDMVITMSWIGQQLRRYLMSEINFILVTTLMGFTDMANGEERQDVSMLEVANITLIIDQISFSLEVERYVWKNKEKVAYLLSLSANAYEIERSKLHIIRMVSYNLLTLVETDKYRSYYCSYMAATIIYNIVYEVTIIMGGTLMQSHRWSYNFMHIHYIIDQN